MASTQLPALETRDLILIRTLVDHGGVTRAARALHLSQSAVSHHLGRLEEKLGVSLFDRAGRGLSLTSAGRRLLDGGDEILVRLRALEATLQPKGAVRLRVGTQCHTAYDWLAPVLRRFEQRNPAATVEIRLDVGRDLLKAIDSDLLDVAISHAEPRPGHRATFLVDDPFAVVLPRGHRCARQEAISPASLREETLLTHDLPVEELRAIGTALFGAQPPRRLLRIPVTEAILQLVANNFGVSIMPSWAARPATLREDLVVRRLASAKATRRWRAIRKAEHPAHEEIKILVSELVAWFRA